MSRLIARTKTPRGDEKGLGRRESERITYAPGQLAKILKGIRTRAAKLGITIEEACAQIGLHDRAIDQWERGH